MTQDSLETDLDSYSSYILCSVLSLALNKTLKEPFRNKNIAKTMVNFEQRQHGPINKLNFCGYLLQL
jgi:hypothetical protein